MVPTTGGRRLLVLIRRTATIATGSANPIQPQPHAACFSRRNFFTPASTRAAPDDSESSHATTVSYLVASCGLSPAAAAAKANAGFRVVYTDKADAVLALLRRYGFSDAQIADLIRLSPKLLMNDPDKTLRPKLEFFASLGFDSRWLAKIKFLEHSLDKHIIPCIEFLRGILGTDANIRLAAYRNPYVLSFDLEKYMHPALQALRHHSLSDEVILKLVLIQIGVLSLTPSRIAGIFEDLEAIGIPTSDSRFVNCFRVMVSIKKDTWLRKVALYRSLGVSEGELLRAFKSQPTIMQLSEENIKKKIHFFLNELKLDLSYVMRRPKIIGYNMEKCILPRCAVLSILMREGKIEQDINLLQALPDNCKTFLKRYVLSYAGDLPDVVEAYEGKIKFEGFKDRMV